jgi:hypothetical protein
MAPGLASLISLGKFQFLRILVGHKFGIKLWVLDGAVSGYIIYFFPYRGRRYDPVPNGEMQGTH